MTRVILFLLWLSVMVVSYFAGRLSHQVDRYSVEGFVFVVSVAAYALAVSALGGVLILARDVTANNKLIQKAADAMRDPPK